MERAGIGEGQGYVVRMGECEEYKYLGHYTSEEEDLQRGRSEQVTEVEEAKLYGAGFFVELGLLREGSFGVSNVTRGSFWYGGSGQF